MFNLLKNLFSAPDRSEFKEIMKNKPLLVDVRTREEFQGGSVKGAVNIPLNTVSKDLRRFAGKGNIVVFCRSGNRSSQAKIILDQAGVSKVYNGGSLHNIQNLLKQN
ncbi:rhodanese-like domain-containing protein [Marnyiella aurantia]|uniref:Rhodanese-like domain-containing protein n=1 Tax=Marnyiella aurantia TaxID=2758037 RepID=A0A7D7LQA9_9FLAO|nr:rhodanese-like domain-containing protein [Marnyiella aurantia]MBA5245672.1 rhodanese-like domain-containing protein [Marnyiella aurantia]QMS98920.1 rhodanese-like domain-containing protein [Marnyiella aurantia]